MFGSSSFLVYCRHCFTAFCHFLFLKGSPRVISFLSYAIKLLLLPEYLLDTSLPFEIQKLARFGLLGVYYFYLEQREPSELNTNHHSFHKHLNLL